MNPGVSMGDAARNERELIHKCPPEGSGRCPCCGLTPFELPTTDRMSVDWADVTCWPEDERREVAAVGASLSEFDTASMNGAATASPILRLQKVPNPGVSMGDARIDARTLEQEIDALEGEALKDGEFVGITNVADSSNTRLDARIEAVAKVVWAGSHAGYRTPWERAERIAQRDCKEIAAEALAAADAVERPAVERLVAALRALVGEHWHRGTAVGLTQANVDLARNLLAEFGQQPTGDAETVPRGGYDYPTTAEVLAGGHRKGQGSRPAEQPTGDES